MSQLLDAIFNASFDVVNDVPLVNEFYEGEEMNALDFENVTSNFKTYMDLVKFVNADDKIMNSTIHFIGGREKVIPGFQTGTVREYLMQVYKLISPGLPLYLGLTSEQLHPSNIQDLRDVLSELFFDRASRLGYTKMAVDDLEKMASTYLDAIVEFIEFHNKEDMKAGYLSYVIEAYNTALSDVTSVIAY